MSGDSHIIGKYGVAADLTVVRNMHVGHEEIARTDARDAVILHGADRDRAVFPNPNQDLLPGMFVRAHLVEGVRPDGIKVHMQSVMRDVRGDSYVYIVTPENKVEQRSVTVARTDGVYWVVDTGLKAGDRVMFEGFQRVQPGATVTAKEVDFSSLPEGKPLF